LAISFNRNPSTGDFGIVKDENAIKQSVRNLILTMFGEKPFQETIGSKVKMLLFEPWDVFAKDVIEDEIKDTIARLEPRVVVDSVDLTDDSEINSIQVSIDYTIVGQTLVQTVDFLLEKA